MNRVHWGLIMCALAVAVASGSSGCKSSSAQKGNTNFFTSGSREADQRASQRMAQSEQLSGSGEGTGEKGVKKAAVATEKLSLFDRLGGAAGITEIVSDLTPRVMDDPRVNWSREGVTRGGFSIHSHQSEAWKPTQQNVALLKKHLVEFLALATGGPAQYTGKQIEPVHAHMHISNPEFDAAIGDLKATFDRLKIPNLEQKELIAIIESTRPQIVTQR